MKKYIIILSVLLIDIGSGSFAQPINSPTELEAEFENNSYVKVKWEDNSNNELGFIVERALDGDSLSWEVVGQTNANVRIYNDYWILLNRLYHYRAYAYNSGGNSGYSNSDTVSTYGDTTNIPSAPTNLQVVKTTLTSIKIQWEDNAVNEFGFIVARKRPGIPYFEFIDSVGSDVLTYQEVGLTPDNVYFYKVCAYNNFGISDYTNTVSARTEESTIIRTNTESASDYYLSNNYPNPFNPSTTIRFGLKSAAEVRLSVYDSKGGKVAVLFEGRLPEGSYSHVWHASGLSSGAYFSRLEIMAGNSSTFSETRKMILAK
ncbi:MAG: fibronectin type III domain-containing protein [Ignavibacteria bacterium]|nr:fibronectin type III domain-containing protein [Ignavibacteria bacterium]